MWTNFKNKMMTAKNKDGLEIAFVVILDDNAKLTEDPEDFEKYRPTYTQRFDTKAEYEQDRIVRIMRGEL